MREIKFQAWGSVNAKMIDWDTIKSHLIMPGSSGWKWREFTGFHDKNGKGEELYAHDFIINLSRNGGKPHEIVWSDTFGGWCGKYGALEYLIAQELAEITKVGNSFSNPELLEAKK